MPATTEMPSPTRGPSLRFGFRQLAIVTVLCGLLFGFWQAWGLVASLAVLTGGSLTLFTTVLLVAITSRIVLGPAVTRRRGWRLFQAGLVLSLWTFWASFAGLLVSGGGAGVAHLVTQRTQRVAAQQTYGFTVRPATFSREGQPHPYSLVTHVQTGGPFEAAAIRPGDVIALAPETLYQQLTDGSDQPVELEVASGGTTGNWQDYQIRQVVVERVSRRAGAPSDREPASLLINE